ncbi:ABC transporter substrate-binding protein [Chelatococcus asaccharovorans]|uniref:ABC transporter substrate-binding protein n=1 Tax=Chelatococcus asaccharovorans TaxID=28210 RepID=UPI00224C6697|nr:ABC transporter substrate-binding protein [Chelatococcus asaccharovorans]CAH1659451.1 Branched-chain amino acid transport system substrate-binding protein [Chelatococcus asaccharovorans]CAH1687934.1 Branched-chain amino acid transport system substrate-binding protein [Chelatococcus asaccharovorans]
MKRRHSVLVSATLAMALVMSANQAHSEIKIGIAHSLSGPAASQGIPQKQAIEMAIPAEIGGEKVRIVALDDATDPSVAARNAKKLIEEEKVDIILGPTATPSAIAMAQIAAAAEVPIMPGAPVSLRDARDTWLFNVPPPPSKWIVPVAADMKRRGIKTVGFLGFSDAWGDICLAALKEQAEKLGLKIVAEERYARADTSVTGQVLKLLAAKPDAIFLGVSGTAGVLGNVAIVERGYNGPIYNSNGVFNGDFLTLGGKSLEGIYGTIGAIAIPDSLSDSEPRKAVVVDFLRKFDEKYGKGKADAISGFGYDAGLLASAAIEKALASAKPGTPEFRAAIAAEIRKLQRIPGTHSIYTYNDPTWPWGVGDDATFLVKVQKGKWVLAN